MLKLLQFTPPWKIRREFKRLWQQLIGVVQPIWEKRDLRLHDHWFDNQVNVHQGHQQKNSFIAILVLYQPGGVPKSIFNLCKHLSKRGYSVLVVSSCPIVDSDHEKLLKLVWKVFERPNFGYDFGSYRDGIKLLWRLDITPTRLVLINDSVFYPLMAGDQTLEALGELECDIGGIVMRMRGNRQFLEGYFYSISQRAFLSKEFTYFWKNYRVSSNKRTVIRLGERGFSKAMLAAGLTVRSLYQRASFVDKINSLSEDELAKVLKHHATVYSSLEEKRSWIIRSRMQKNWRNLVKGYIYEVLMRGEFYILFPLTAAELMGFPVLKKSVDPAYILSRKLLIAATKDGELDRLDTVVRSELFKLTCTDKIFSKSKSSGEITFQ